MREIRPDMAHGSGVVPHVIGAGPGAMSLGELNEYIATLPIDARRIKGLGPITGQVAAAGTITAGTGFTVNNSAAGVYDITFDSPFAAAPTVIVSNGNMGTVSRVFRVTAVAAGTCTVKCSAAANEPFNFVAYATV